MSVIDVVVGAELEKERGLFILLHDPETGQLKFDQTITSPAGMVGYIDLEWKSWPHGDSGAAWAHSALFLPASEAYP
jgi:hypothetical protein